jgi:hypothetical protein
VPTEFAATVVIAGLDPAIHCLRKTFFRRMMDPRVKPAGDGSRWSSLTPVSCPARSQACADCVNLSALPDIHVLLSSSAKDRMAARTRAGRAAARANIYATSFYFARV